jgi:hypothetical protein
MLLVHDRFNVIQKKYYALAILLSFIFFSKHYVSGLDQHLEESNICTFTKVNQKSLIHMRLAIFIAIIFYPAGSGLIQNMLLSTCLDPPKLNELLLITFSVQKNTILHRLLK